MTPQRSHSRATGVIRLLLALWLIYAGVRTLANPHQATIDQGLPMSVVLPLAGLYFALGVFLLTGFLSRVIGLALVGIGVWEAASLGIALTAMVLLVAGVYLALRGGGAWAMDIYVQKMQDRARRKSLSSPESWQSPSRG